MYSHLLDEISRAIGARLLIRFTYKNKEYFVEPHLVGKNLEAEDCLLAWQITKDKIVAAESGWKCFELSRLSELKLLEKRFTSPRPGYDPYDNSMSRIYYRI
jgi:predicted DNA-binding transcriptional regulator YafY